MWLKKEAEAEPKFDTLGAKALLWNGYLQRQYTLVCKVCPYGKVLTFVEVGHIDPTPWETWARIFQIFGPHGWRVGFFPHPAKRVLPEPGQPVGPGNVNGGYAYPCKPNSIIIYREEEATRVLLHELFHAACCDRDLELPQKEAETEAWAEWLLVALASKGKLSKAKELFQEQLNWMAATHATLERFYGIKGPEDYAWRYTIGREEAYCRLGATVPKARIQKPRTSSRLTSPVLDKLE